GARWPRPLSTSKPAGRCASAHANLPGKRRANCTRRSTTRTSSKCWPIVNCRRAFFLASSGCMSRSTQMNFPATKRNAHSVPSAEKVSITIATSCATERNYATAATIRRHGITSPSTPRRQHNNTEVSGLSCLNVISDVLQTQKCPANCRALLLALDYVTSFLRPSSPTSLQVTSLPQPSWLEPSLLPFSLPF